MDMHVADEEVYAQDYTELNSLYEQNLFQDLWNKASSIWGQAQWPTAKLELLRARTLSQLGNNRSADALLWQLWRNVPQLEGLAPLVATLHLRRFGPLVALQKLPLISERAQPSEKDLTALRAEKAEILAHFRDFSAADEAAQGLETLNDNWLLLTLAEIKFRQDDYAQALAIVDQALAKTPDYRPALYFKANILQLQHNLSSAIDLLAGVWPSYQSFWVGRLLCSLYIENQQYPQAHECLQQLKSLPVLERRDSQQILRSLQADLLCAEQRYEEALEFIEQKSWFGKSVSEAIKRGGDTNKRKVLNLPFVRQANMTCAPASLSSVASYWGVQIDQADIVEAICYNGTYSEDERRWAEENGWFVQELQLDFTSAKQLLDAGIPILLGTVEPGSAHLQILVGYDEVMETYLLRDPYHRRLQEMLIEGCHKYYAASGPRAMVMVPQNQREQLLSIHLPCSALYDCLYQLERALNNNDRDSACKQLATAQALDENHRITINCERRLAFYDGDETRILAATEKLLALFPEDIGFQLSKVSSLSALGSSKQALEYLENIVASGQAHSMIRSCLADHLRHDHRQLERVEQLYQQLLRYSPTNAKLLYDYAGVLWDKADYAHSYQLYRFAICLEDKNERYAESFFKAARYHKETETGLNFLRDRFMRFGKKSSGPAVSLFNALDSLDLTHEGLDVLDQAIALRPDDGWLMTFAARKFLYSQQSNKAIELAERAKPLVHAVRYHELAADIHTANLEIDQAITSLQTILSFDVLNEKASKDIMRLWIENGQRQRADEFIKQQLAQFPDNAMLLELRIYWIDQTDYEQLVTAYQEYTQHHPNNAWGYRGLANALRAQGNLEPALAAAREAVAIEKNGSANHTCLGQVYLALREREQARTCFRRAIENYCDHSAAYDLLLSCGLTHAAQQEELQFIYDQLMAQVSYGDGILEYQYIAWQILPANSVIEFLEHALQARPDLWQSWVALTLAYRNLGNNQKALEIITGAAERFPLLPRIFFELAETYRIVNQAEPAEKFYRQALELSPGWTTPANNLCDLYEQQGRYEEAIAIQRSVCARNPLASSPYGYIADLLLREDKVDEAIATLETALERHSQYYWAWRRLFSLYKDRQQEHLICERVASLRKKLVDDADLVLLHAWMQADDNTACELLGKFLERHPHNISVCTDYVERQTALGHYDHALQFTSEAYWNNNRHLAILAAEAKIFAEQHDLEKAIAAMEAVASINENYYEAWRCLTIWYLQAHDAKNATRAIDNCVRLYPNDPIVLCFAAEKLEAIDGDKNRIGDLLQRAFELNPVNQYNGLTYIDYILGQKDYARAAQAHAILQRHNRDIYTDYRGLQIAIALEQHEDALAVFKAILTAPDETGWFIANAWEQLKKLKQETKGADIIRELHHAKQLPNNQAARCLAELDIQQLGRKKVERALLKKNYSDDFERRYLEGYIHHIKDNNVLPPDALLQQHKDAIHGDVKLWALIGQLYIGQDRWYQAANWLDAPKHEAQAEASALYFQSLALREAGKWDAGVQAMALAYAKTPDSYREDIASWYCMDLLLQNRPAPTAELTYIRNEDLAGLSRYPCKLAKLLGELNKRMSDGNTVEQCYKDIQPLFEQSRFAFSGIESKSWRQAKKMASQLLISKLETQGWKRWLWIFILRYRI